MMPAPASGAEQLSPTWPAPVGLLLGASRITALGRSAPFGSLPLGLLLSSKPVESGKDGAFDLACSRTTDFSRAHQVGRRPHLPG